MGTTVEQLKPPAGAETTRKPGSLKPKTIDKLAPNQRAWAANVMKVLGLKSTSSQARVLSGAIASAQLIEQNGTAPDKATAQQLRAIVIAAGTPPWKDAKKAMAATDAKMQLDLLSIPVAQRKPKPLDPAKQGINQAFWLDRQDADGQERHSFLCKPASGDPGDQHSADADSGGKKGGEVAREALSGRAAQLLAAKTGIDIGMPETHVVNLDGTTLGLPAGPLTCSIQEARPAKGDLQGLGQLARSSLNSTQVAGLAIFDALTLNTDRHDGNVLRDANDNLVPIDHGESFAEANDQGIERIRAAIGTPHNALLALPGAHVPMSKEMVKKLKALNADKFASDLAKDNTKIGEEHPGMQGAISDGAIENVRRAAMFTKLAAKNDPPLSPAAIQVAMGNAAELLFDPAIDDATFKANAQAAIDRIAPQQAAVREVCTSLDPEYAVLAEKAAALGWPVAERSGAPSADTVADPVTLLTIVKQNINCPTKMAQIKAKIRQIETAPPGQSLTPADAMATVLDVRLETFRQLSAIMDVKDAKDVRGRVTTIERRAPADVPHDLAMLMPLAITNATKNQQARLDALDTTHRIRDLMREDIVFNRTTVNPFNDAVEALGASMPIEAAKSLDGLQTYAAAGEYLPASCTMMASRLRRLEDTLMIPPNDADLVAGLAAAGATDPFTAKTRHDSLVSRSKAGEFINKPLAQLQGELDRLTGQYTIDASSKWLVAAKAAIQGRDPIGAAQALEELNSAAKRNIFPPSEAGLKTLVSVLSVPNDDPDLQEAQDALTSADAKKLMTAVERLKTRHKSGGFGTTGIDELTKRLTILLGKLTIPDQDATLAAVKAELKDNDPVAAWSCIMRLAELAKAGRYPAKN